MLKISGSTLQNAKAQATKSLGIVYPCVSFSSEKRFNYLDREISQLDPAYNQLNSFHTYMNNFFNVHFNIILRLNVASSFSLSDSRIEILYEFLITLTVGNLLVCLVAVGF